MALHQKKKTSVWKKRLLVGLLFVVGTFSSFFLIGQLADAAQYDLGNVSLATLDGDTVTEKPILLAENTTTTASSDTLSPDAQKLVLNIAQILNYLMSTLYLVLIPIVVIIGKFMSNDWITGSVFNVDLVIEMIWQIVRNLVNVFIVFYLLYLAGANIIPGSWAKNAELKKKLPQVALALILVNFSLFFCRTILTISNITTTTAFAMPNTIGTAVFDNTVLSRYNPFIWAAPITSSDIVGYTGAGSATAAPKDHAYALECLHENYAVNLNNQNGKQPLVIANPSVTNGHPSTYALWYYRLYFTATDNNGIARGVNDKRQYVMDQAQGGSVQQLSAVEATARQVLNTYKPADINALRTNPAFISANTKIASDRQAYDIIILDTTTVYPVSDPLNSAQKLTKEQVQLKIDSLIVARDAYALLITEPGFNQVKTNATTTTGSGSYPYYQDCITNWDKLAFSSRNAMFAYAFNLLRVQDYQAVLSSVRTYEDIVSKEILSLVFLLFFFLVNIALLIAMVIRGVLLWVMMAASPIWVLTTFLAIKLPGKDTEKNIGGFVKFSSLAFMPTAVGLVLSTGFMMIHYLKYVGTIEGGGVGRIAVGSINILYDASTPIIGGLSNLIDMIFAIMAIAVLWTGVFAAINFGLKDEWFKKAIEPIQNFGSSVGKAVLSAPLHAPIIPIPGMGATSPLAAMKKLEGITGGLESFSRGDQSIYDALNGKSEKQEKIDSAKVEKNLKTVTNASEIGDAIGLGMGKWMSNAETQKMLAPLFSRLDKNGVMQVATEDEVKRDKVAVNIDGKTMEMPAAAWNDFATKFNTKLEEKDRKRFVVDRAIMEKGEGTDMTAQRIKNLFVDTMGASGMNFGSDSKEKDKTGEIKQSLIDNNKLEVNGKLVLDLGSYKGNGGVIAPEILAANLLSSDQAKFVQGEKKLEEIVKAIKAKDGNLIEGKNQFTHLQDYLKSHGVSTVKEYQGYGLTKGEHEIKAIMEAMKTKNKTP